MPRVTELLRKYGTNLEDTKRLIAELPGAVEAEITADRAAQRLPEGIYSFDEAMSEFGVDLPDANYRLKIDKGGNVSYLTPDNYEIGQNTLKTPEGQFYTLDQLAEQERQEQGFEVPGEILPQQVEAPGEILPQTDFIPFVEAPDEIAAIEANKQLFQTQQADYERIKKALGAVYSPEFYGEDVTGLLQQIDANPDQFLTEIQSIGRTPDTENLIKTLFPFATDEEVNALFAQPELEAQAIKIEDTVAYLDQMFALENARSGNLDPNDASAIDRAMIEMGLNFSAGSGVVQWRNNTLTPEQKLEIANIYLQDPNKGNAFAGMMAGLRQAEEKTPALALATSPFTSVGVPIAKIMTGQEVSKEEWIDAGIMVALSVIPGLDKLGTLGKVGAKAIMAGAGAYQTKQTVENWDAMTPEQRAMAIGMDVALLAGGFPGKGFLKKAGVNSKTLIQDVNKTISENKTLAENANYPGWGLIGKTPEGKLPQKPIVPKEPIKEPWMMTREEWNDAVRKTQIDYTGSQGNRGMGRATTEKGMSSSGLEERLRLRYGISDKNIEGLQIPAQHEQVVQKALSEGKPVPESVLKDYPDLKPTPEGIKTPVEAPTLKSEGLKTPTGKTIPTEEIKPPVVEGKVPPVEPPKVATGQAPPSQPPKAPPQSVVPPEPIRMPKSANPKIDSIITQSVEQIRQDKPGALKQLFAKLPGIKQALEFERPGLKMTGENEKVLTAMVAENAARSEVQVWAAGTRLSLLRDIRKYFGKDSLRGGKVDVKFKGTPEQAKNPITGTLKDIADNPELYELNDNQQGVLSLMEARNDQLLEYVVNKYGAEIGRFSPKEGGAFLPNVDISDDIIEFLGSETRAAATGRAKTRIWQTARERMAGKTPFKPELDVQKLIEGLDNFKSGAAAGQTYRKAIGGLTRLEAMETTHPALYERMIGLRKKLQKLQGYKNVLETDELNAIDDFLNSGFEDTDIGVLRDSLELKPGRYVAKAQAGKTLADLQTEIAAVRQELADIRPMWQNANLKPYVFVQEGVFKYFPAETAKLIKESKAITNNRLLNFVERWRAGAFSGDASPFAIQGVVGVLADPLGSLKAAAGGLKTAIQKHDLFRSVKVEALADDIAFNPNEWSEYASLMGRGLTGTPKEYAAGFMSKLPGFDKFTESTYVTVTRSSFNLWQRTYKNMVKSGVPALEAKVAAAQLASEVYPLASATKLGQSQARASVLRALPTSYSFIRQPASLLEQATIGMAKLIANKPLNAKESLALKTAIVGAASTLAASATSAALSAYYQGKSEDEIWDAVWAAINPDPYNGNFASIVIGNKRIPLGGPYRAMFRAMFPQEVEGVPFPVPFAGVPNYFKNRISPAIGTQIDLVTNKDWSGNQIIKGNFPENIGRALAYEFENFLPLTAGTAIEATRQGDKYKEDVWQQVISQFMGVNLITMDNTYLDRKIKYLGLEDPTSEAKPYEPLTPNLYTTKDLWGDSYFIKDIPVDQMDRRGFDKKIKAIREAMEVKKITDGLANERFVKIDFDLLQKRQDLLDDKEGLAVFDKDNPTLAGIGQREYALLREYNSLTDKKAQAEFLKAHPELDLNPREEWLKSHPDENARLAIWGQAKVLTQKAYDKALTLIKELDIPDSAVKDFLPPKEFAKPYFDYQDIVSKFGANSAEARIVGIKNPKLFEWIGREAVQDNLQALELQAKNRDLITKYDSFSDKESAGYLPSIPDKNSPDYQKGREYAREQLKKNNSQFADDLLKIDAFKAGATDDIVKKHLDFHHEDNEAKKLQYYLKNNDYYRWAYENGFTTNDGGLPDGDPLLNAKGRNSEKWNIPVIKIKAQDAFIKADEEYKGYSNPDSEFYLTEGREEALKQFRLDNPDWVDDQNRIEAYNHGADAEMAEFWAEHGRVASAKPGYEAEEKLWLVDNPEVFKWALDNELLTDDGKDWNIPVLRINAKYRVQDDEYNAIQNDDERVQKQLRKEYLQANPDYDIARHDRDAYNLGLAEDMVDNWTEYNQLPDYGKWRDRYRKEHPDFDNAVKTQQKAKGQSPWADIEPDKIPAVQYDQIYEQFKRQFDEYDNVQGTPTERADARKRIFQTDPQFKAAYYKRQAYGELFPEQYIQNYADYYMIPATGYAQERYLKEHQDFYNVIKAKKEWKDTIKFDEIPTAEVERLYGIYQKLPTTGKQREAYRKEHPDLDEWLIRVVGLKPLDHVHKKTTATEFIEKMESDYQQAQEAMRRAGIK